MSDITEEEAAILMVEMKLQIMEISLKSLSTIIEQCAQSVADLEKTIGELYGSDS